MVQKLKQMYRVFGKDDEEKKLLISQADDTLTITVDGHVRKANFDGLAEEMGVIKSVLEDCKSVPEDSVLLMGVIKSVSEDSVLLKGVTNQVTTAKEMSLNHMYICKNDDIPTRPEIIAARL